MYATILFMKRWTEQKEIPSETHNELASYPEFIRDLLFNRGIDTKEKAEQFLNPDYERDLHDPFLMLNMDRAVGRILEAINKKEKIIVFADCDADGIPGSVVLNDFFLKVGHENFEIYIPHRYKEKYGLNIDAIKKFKNDGASLLITVDCGITDNEEVAYATKEGIDVIVTDHHLPGEDLPSAYAIVNPNQKECSYPNPNLCGGGVAFKLVQALIDKGNFEVGPNGWEKWLIDAAGISTISDMVPLTGENRAIAHFGLKVLRKTNRPGIAKLLQKKRIAQNQVTEEDVGFTITPHINAATRMGVPHNAFLMLKTRDGLEAHEYVQYLHQKNEERKKTVQTLLEEIDDRIGDVSNKEIISLGDPAWLPGILGLAANRVVEKYKKPVCLWGQEGSDVVRGSCRGDGSVHVKQLMDEIGSDFFLNHGGHVHSGGFSVGDSDVSKIENKFEEAYKKVKEESVDEELLIDKTLTLNDINWGNYALLESLAPYGVGNAKPLFKFEKLKIKEASFFGKTGTHLKLVFERPGSWGMPAIQFFAHDYEDGLNLEPGNYVDVLAHIEKDMFRRNPSLRLRLVDIKEAEL